MKPELSPLIDPFASLRDASAAAARNLGFATGVQKLPPELGQRVLSAVEARARMRGVNLAEGWREELAEQMGRGSLTANVEPES